MTVNPISKPFSLNLGQISDTSALTSPECPLEDGNPCRFENNPRGDEPEDDQERSPIVYPEQEVAFTSEQVKELPHKINTDASSPILSKKPYGFARSKINFTMEDLEHSSSENDEDFQNNCKPNTLSMRSQPKRSCNIEQNLVFDESISYEDEQVVENLKSQNQNDNAAQQISDSESNSDWYPSETESSNGKSEVNHKQDQPMFEDYQDSRASIILRV